MIIIEIADDGKGIDVEAVRTKAVERGLIHPSKVLTEVEAFNLIFDAGFSTAQEGDQHLRPRRRPRRRAAPGREAQRLRHRIEHQG